MYYSKKFIEKCIKEFSKNKKGHGRNNSAHRGGMKKNRSFLSMDNLDVEEQKEEDETSNDNISLDDSDSEKPSNRVSRKYDSDDSTVNRRGKL